MTIKIEMNKAVLIRASDKRGVSMYLNVFIVAFIFDIILEILKKWKLYYWGIRVIPYTRYDLVTSIEKILYKVTYVARKIPYLIYRPGNFDMDDIQDDFNNAVKKSEKLLIVFEGIVGFIRMFIGIRIAYVIMLGMWIWSKYKDTIYEVVKRVVEVDILDKIQQVYDYIRSNGSAILIVIIVVLSLYILYIKKRISHFVFEEIWEKENVERIKPIAEKQIEIAELLSEIDMPVYRNCVACKESIQRVDNAIKHSFEFSAQYSFEDYMPIVDEIKEKIKYIEENKGKQQYLKYNAAVLFQLYMLGLSDSSSKIRWRGIGSCSKNEIEKRVKNIDAKNLKGIRNELFSCWVNCIVVLNGIDRYRYYISKRMNKYGKLHSSLYNISGIKDIISEAKK